MVSGWRSRPDTVCQRNRTLFRYERTKCKHAEQFIEGALWVIDLLEPTGRTCQEEDPRFGLKRLAESPAGLRVRDIPKHHVQVFDHRYEAFALAVREILKGANAPIGEHLVVPDVPQFLERAVQVWLVFALWRLVREAGKAFEPKLAGARDLVAFLGKDHGEETR